jgi:hypothetical protein
MDRAERWHVAAHESARPADARVDRTYFPVFDPAAVFAALAPLGIQSADDLRAAYAHR